MESIRLYLDGKCKKNYKDVRQSLEKLSFANWSKLKVKS